MSKLATIEKIESVSKVENSDHLHKYIVLGWQCVSRSEYKVGDKVIYIRTDTVVTPKNPVFAFLEKQDWRVKPMRLRGEYSNGLILPWDEFFSECPEVGTEVSEQIGVTKYEKPVSYQAADIAGPFPDYISKTDEENIQNVPDILNDIYEQEYYSTIKLDGSSTTYVRDTNGDFKVCSRTLELKENTLSQYWIPAIEGDFKNIIPIGYAVQGELCGPKIQKNPLGLTKPTFFMFNVINIQTRKLLNYKEMLDFEDQTGIQMVPVYDSGIFKYKTIQELENVVQQVKYQNGKNAEGLVFRLQNPKFNFKVNKELSFKIINPKYKD